MRRREVIVAGALAGAALAGCTGRGGDGPSTDAPPTGNGTTVHEPAPPVALVGRSFAVRERGCGNPEDAATVSFDRDALEVEVGGRIAGSDTCRTAGLAAADYDAAADELRVVVATESAVPPGETPACGECIVEIDYEATVRFEGGLPERVVVVHRGVNGERTVATARDPA